MGIGLSMGIPAPMVAGAVISGAYFGDKMSPLSIASFVVVVLLARSFASDGLSVNSGLPSSCVCESVGNGDPLSAMASGFGGFAREAPG